jgi:cysteine desulfurase
VQSTYLDYAATTPLRPAARTAMLAALDTFGNPSSVHRAGQAARAMMDDARRHLAAALGVRAERVVLTSGGTEANNLALRGVMAAARGKVVLTSATEHDCVRHTAAALAAAGVGGHELIPVDKNGLVDMAWLATRLAKGNVALVSVMHANNETGVLNPVAEVAALAHQFGALMHTDAVQTVGHIPVQVDDLGADVLSLTAHKFGGPKGAGALIVKPEIAMHAHITGGGQERNRRAGTENVAAMAGMAAALDVAISSMPAETELAHQMAAALEKNLPHGFQIIAPHAAKVPHVRLILTPFAGEMLVMKADMAGVCVSQGSACSSGRVVPSHVLLAMGYSEAEALQAVRLSWGWGSAVADIGVGLSALA